MVAELFWRLLSFVVVGGLLSVTFFTASSPTDDVAELARLPRFVNLAPADAQSRAQIALATLEVGDSSWAAEELSSLGGVALPFVVPRLDTLSRESRARVLKAIEPLAPRVGVDLSPRADGGDAASAWLEFWEDHALDFTPAAARRAVSHYVEHPSAARRAAVEHLDTAALVPLFDALGRQGPMPTSAVYDAVVPLLSRTFRPSERASTKAAVTLELRAAWLVEGLHYSTLAGPDRLMAVVTETQLGKWLGLALAANAAPTRAGASAAAVVVRQAPGALSCFAVAGALSLALAPPLAAAAYLARRRGRLLLAAAGVACVAVAPLLAASRLALDAAAAALVVLPAAIVATYAALSDAMAKPHVVAARAQGASFGRITLREAFRAALQVAPRELSLRAPWVLLAMMVAQALTGRRGVGATFTAALSKQDMATLLWLSLLGLALVSLIELCAALLIRAIDRRPRAFDEAGS